MKKDVVIICNESGMWCESLEKQIKKTFPKKVFNVVVINNLIDGKFARVIDHKKSIKFWRKMTEMWMALRSPIVIAIGSQAVADALPIRNYSHRYLVATDMSDFLSKRFGIKTNVTADEFFKHYKEDDYGIVNTYCFFGGDEKDIEIAKQIERTFPNTFYDTCNEYIDTCRVIESIKEVDIMLTKREMDTPQ